MRRAFVLVCMVGAMVFGTASTAQAAPPSNDDVADATVVSSLPFENAVDNSEATYAAVDGGCGVATVWYRYTPVADGRISIAAYSERWTPQVGLRVGDPSNLTACSSYEPVRAYVTAGETYYISLGTYGSGEPGMVGPGGDLMFWISEIPPPVTTITTTGYQATVDNAGVVTVTGTVTCDQMAWATIGITVEQRTGRRLAQGSGWADAVICSPEPTAWTARISTGTGTLFGPGHAVLDGYRSASDTMDGYVYETIPDVDLHMRRRN